MVISPHDKQQRDPDRDELGPVDFLAIEFPDAGKAAPGFERLISLAHQGVVGILDLEFIAKDSAGNARKVHPDQLELDGLDALGLGAWSAASSGLLDDGDVGEIAEAIAPGSAAAVIVCENRWVLGLLDTWRRSGARLIADSGIPANDVAAALDPVEPS